MTNKVRLTQTIRHRLQTVDATITILFNSMTSLEPVRLERFRSVPPYKVTVSDLFKTAGQPFLYAKLLRNGTVGPPSVPAEQALNFSSYMPLIMVQN